ncbi:MAG: VPS10 domain-containing protein [Betaproteobacteria bacterium]
MTTGSNPTHRVLWSTVAALALAALVQFTVRAQAPAARGPSAEMAALAHLTFRNIGPTNQAGRVSVIVGVPGDPYTFYVAGANGGVFKTTNGGTTWKALFDDQPVLSIGAIEIAPSNPDVIYVGTGEENPRNNASFGNGVYRSDDGGATWRHLGLPDSDRIARIRIDSRDPDVAYVCAMGHEWGPNDERGVYKTTDGGRNWKRLLFVDQQTACSDIDVDPNNSNVIYAGMWTYRRYAWLLDSGGRQTALYKSVDGGATWKKLTNGIPAMLDRIGVSVSRSEPNIVYMVSETPNYQGELWRSDDAGASWRVVNKDPNINFRPFYYADIRVDPNDPNRIYSLSGSLYLSEDAGRNFRRIGNDVHGDHQALWIDPTNSKRVLSGSDGGFQVSYDGGKNFNVLNNIAFTQFYHINYDMQKPYMVCGGLQDNGTWCGPSNSLLSEGIRKNDWFTVGGGDGFFAVPDMKEPWRVYTDLQGGVISVMDTRSGASRAISPYPNRIGSVGDAMENHKYRYNWNSPIVLSPQDGQTVYFGGDVLFKTTNHGQSWTAISPDLTTNDKNKQKSSGGPIVTDNTAAEFHCTIITIAPSPVDANVIWVGTDDGNVQVTRDGGKTWTNTIKNVPGLAPNAWIPTVEASHYDAGTAYIAADHHQDDDYTAYFFKTTDYGKTWTRLTIGDPKVTGWPHVIREDPKVRTLLYAGTELGLWVSFDGGSNWTSLRQNMPPVPVRDIQIQPRDNDLLVATHGRGLWVMDDITPLQHIAGALRTDVDLFDIRPATRWSIWGKDGNLGQAVWKAPNPPQGAIIDYYLKADQKDDVIVTITDSSGKPVRTLRRAPKTAGVNRVTWDLRYDPPRPIGGREEEENQYRFAGGPFVIPGDYTVKVHAAGRDLTKTVKVEMDPRVPVTMADLQAQLDAALALRDMMSKVNVTIDRANSLIEQLTSLSERLKKQPGPAGLAQDVAAALQAVTKLRDEQLTRPYPSMGYRQYPRVREEIQSLSGSVSRAQTRPTDPEAGRMKELTAELDKDIAALTQIIGGPISAINESMRSAPFIVTEIK